VRLFALGLGILLALVAAEFCLRLIGIGYPNFYETDAYCGFRLRKFASGVWTHEGHGHVSVNSLGFRGPEFSIEKERGVFRIAVLGDSFIEAKQVDLDKTFCHRLEGLLNERAGSLQRIEVIN
jgi:hypothetical protein